MPNNIKLERFRIMCLEGCRLGWLASCLNSSFADRSSFPPMPPNEKKLVKKVYFYPLQLISHSRLQILQSYHSAQNNSNQGFVLS